MEVDVEEIINLKIPLEGYFILHCLYNEEEDVLLNYIINVNKIPTKVFKLLVDNEYLTHDGSPNYTLDNIELTNKWKKEVKEEKKIKKNITFEEAFQELRNSYPTRTPDNRRLHQDIERCKRLYRKEIVIGSVINIEKHSFILQCINFLVNEKARSNKLNFLKMLPTLLQQKEWTTVEEDVKSSIKRGEEIGKILNGDNKTILGTKDF